MPTVRCSFSDACELVSNEYSMYSTARVGGTTRFTATWSLTRILAFVTRTPLYSSYCINAFVVTFDDDLVMMSRVISGYGRVPLNMLESACSFMSDTEDTLLALTNLTFDVLSTVIHPLASTASPLDKLEKDFPD